MARVLLLATTTGYQTRAFGEAAERLGIELVFATDRCRVIDDPWRDQAIPIRFYDEPGSVGAILDAGRARPVDGVLVVGDRPTVIGASVAQSLGLPWHPPQAAAVARNKQRTRERFRDCGLSVPWFAPASIADDARDLAASASYPCVIKPLALSGSRGVIRADNQEELVAAFERLRALLRSPEIRAERNDAHEGVLLEGFVPGREYALEGLLHHGVLTVLALFDKPDPLDGPFFEETIYLTPSEASDGVQAAITDAVARAARAIGLHHGPIHAECRVNLSILRRAADRPEEGRETTLRQARGPSGQVCVFVLEVAARPIGGLCARALRFDRGGVDPDGIRKSGRRLRTGAESRIPNPESKIPLEELLLRHALGESPDEWRREGCAAGVMMIPIPRRGVFRDLDGLDEARGVSGVDDVRVTAKPGQMLIPLPEGASYLGFIFARGNHPREVDRALRAAHRRLRFTIDPGIPVLAPSHIHYNHAHG